MLYRPDPNIRTIKWYMEPRSRCRLPYFTPREMQELYNDGDFMIVGEIGGLARPQEDGDVLMADGARRIPILPRGSIKKPFEWVVGYIPVSRDTYLAVVGSVMPVFLRRWKINQIDKSF